ncbi:MAG: hypothetical protein WD894_02255 [Pirellulales bacterium]
MRLLHVSAACIVLSSVASAEDPSEQAALIDKVMSAVRENDRRLGPLKARLRKEIMTSFKIEAGPPAPAPLPVPPPGGTKSTGLLKVDPHPLQVVEWTAELAGENARFDISGPHGRQTFSVDETGITQYTAKLNRALISPWSDAKSFAGQMQYDPREIGFLTLAEGLRSLRKLGMIESAKTIKHSDEETVIELRSKSFGGGNKPVIECSSRFNFLPTRVYYLYDGHVSAVTDMTYQQVRSDPTPAWFLKSASSRHAFPHKNKSPDDKNWGQTGTVKVSDLQLDALAPPPRDDAHTLPKGARIEDRITPPAAPAPIPQAPMVPNYLVLAVIMLVVVSFGIILYLYGMSTTKADDSEAA